MSAPWRGQSEEGPGTLFPAPVPALWKTGMTRTTLVPVAVMGFTGGGGAVIVLESGEVKRTAVETLVFEPSSVEAALAVARRMLR